MWKRGLYFKTEAEENIVYGKIVDFIAGEQTSTEQYTTKGEKLNLQIIITVDLFKIFSRYVDVNMKMYLFLKFG